MVGVLRAPGGSWDRQGVRGLRVPVTLEGRRLTTLHALTPARRRKLHTRGRQARQDRVKARCGGVIWWQVFDGAGQAAAQMDHTNSFELEGCHSAV
jgi:hypothetical protein